MYGFESFAEVPYATLNTFFGDVAESVTLTTAEQAAFQVNVTVEESISFSASQQASTAFGEVYVVESIGIYDEANVTAQFVSDRAESISVTALQDVIASFVGAQAENITLTTAEAAAFAFFGAVQENIGLTAAQSANATYVRTVNESLTLAESESVTAAFAGTVAETIALADCPCVFGWFGINDDQDPMWGFVNVNVTEIAAYGAFTFGGVPFAGSYTKSGVYPNPIPDEQQPNWAEINDDAPTVWSDINNDQNCDC